MITLSQPQILANLQRPAWPERTQGTDLPVTNRWSLRDPYEGFAASAGVLEQHARQAAAAGSRRLKQIFTPTGEYSLENFPPTRAPDEPLPPLQIKTLPPDYVNANEAPRAGLPRLWKRVQHTVSFGPSCAGFMLPLRSPRSPMLSPASSYSVKL